MDGKLGMFSYPPPRVCLNLNSYVHRNPCSCVVLSVSFHGNIISNSIIEWYTNTVKALRGKENIRYTDSRW